MLTKTLGQNLQNKFFLTTLQYLCLLRKTINVDCLLPSQKLNLKVSANLGAFIKKLGKLWSYPCWKRRMTFFSEVETTDFTFDIDTLLQQNQNEITLASQESIAALPQLYYIFSEHSNSYRFWTQTATEGSPICNYTACSIKIVWITKCSCRQKLLTQRKSWPF